MQLLRRWCLVVVSCIALLALSGCGSSKPYLNEQPGIVAPDDPVQVTLANATPFLFNNAQVTPVASFSMKARVLSIAHYYTDHEAKYAPLDVTFGWQPMSDTAILNKIDITQSGRWYHWQVDDWIIPREAIETNSANMHLIPGNPKVSEALDNLQAGQVVWLNGYLVNIQEEDGWNWFSSQTRNDVGDQSCELIYVQTLERIPNESIYR